MKRTSSDEFAFIRSRAMIIEIYFNCMKIKQRSMFMRQCQGVLIEGLFRHANDSALVSHGHVIHLKLSESGSFVFRN